MGCYCSKALATGGRTKALQFDAGLTSSYMEARRLLLELGSFTATSELGDAPELKDVISNNPDLLCFVKEHIKNSVIALKFLTALKRCLAEVRDRQSLIDEALRCFEAEEKEKDGVAKLEEFKAAGHPFSELFTEEFRLACDQQRTILTRLRLRKQKLDKKLSSVKARRRVWGIVCGMAFAAAMICSVAFAAVAGPHVATATAAAASMAVKAVEQWIDLLLGGQESELSDEREVIRRMLTGTFFLIHELDCIRVLVDQLMNHVRSLSWGVYFTSRGEEVGVRVGVEEIKRKLGEVNKSVCDMEKQMDQCCSGMARAVAESLKVIANEL